MMNSHGFLRCTARAEPLAPLVTSRKLAVVYTMSTQKEETRARLFRRRSQAAGEAGVSPGVGLEDIAEAAGVSRQAVYKSHFASKAEPAARAGTAPAPCGKAR